MKKIIITLLIGLFGAFGLFVLLIRVMADKAKDVRPHESYNRPQFRDGDIIFQTSKSGQSRAIQLATKSKYSHLGIIYETDGQYYVYEAVQPVKLTELNDWIKRGEGSHFVVKRLRDSNSLLTKEALKKMKDLGERYR